MKKFNFSDFFKVTSRKGSELSGHCPWREDKTPSFSANEEKGCWIDFGTGEDGGWNAFCNRINRPDLKRQFNKKL